jgi:gamma-glutamyltranspeptidase/glutathione hydrolase
MLNVLEGYDLKSMGYGSSDAIHVMTESMRRAYADRAEYLGDTAFVDVPVRGLISKDYAEALRATIDLGEASRSVEIVHGNPHMYQEPDHTTHISVVDGDGNAVSLTQTINGSFGCGVVVPGTGILLNNEMDDFAAKPGAPNLYGLVGGEANAILPGKIPLSSMTPTLVFKNDRLMMVLGSPGGPRIITTVLQIIVNVIDHGMDVQEAIDAPRFHHQWLPDEIWLEPFAAPADVVRALEDRGHQVVQKGEFGNAMGVLIDLESGELHGAADSRGVGTAAGY